MTDHYYRTDYYYRKQFRFRKKRSILTCLANIHNVIQRTKAQHQKIVMCVLNFLKAFDCLDIPIMSESLFDQESEVKHSNGEDHGAEATNLESRSKVCCQKKRTLHLDPNKDHPWELDFLTCM